MTFKALIFKSPYTNAVYLWNGSDIICVFGTIQRPVGMLMKGFKDVDFDLIYAMGRTSFKKGDSDYQIISKI